MIQATVTFNYDKIGQINKEKGYNARAITWENLKQNNQFSFQLTTESKLYLYDLDNIIRKHCGNLMCFGSCLIHNNLDIELIKTEFYENEGLIYKKDNKKLTKRIWGLLKNECKKHINKQTLFKEISEYDGKHTLDVTIDKSKWYVIGDGVYEPKATCLVTHQSGKYQLKIMENATNCYPLLIDSIRNGRRIAIARAITWFFPECILYCNFYTRYPHIVNEISFNTAIQTYFNFQYLHMFTFDNFPFYLNDATLYCFSDMNSAETLDYIYNSLLFRCPECKRIFKLDEILDYPVGSFRVIYFCCYENKVDNYY